MNQAWLLEMKEKGNTTMHKNLNNRSFTVLV